MELEEGIDGLVHISDMSWTKRVNHPSEIVKKGDEVHVEVLNIDKEGRRISLGLKQTTPNPWPNIEQKFAAGTMVDGTVTRLIDRGLVVDLGDDIEGFVPLSQLGIDPNKKPSDEFSEGQSLQLRVTRVDGDNQRIVLAVRDAATVEGAGDEDLDDPRPAEESMKSIAERYSGSGSAAIGARLREELAAAEDGDKGGDDDA